MPDDLNARVAAYFQRRPAAMTMVAAQELGVPEVEVLRALGAAELRAEALEEILGELAGWGRCHVIVSNRGATLEAYGTFGGFSRKGPFLNVETETLDMHLRPAAIRAAFCLDKRGHRDAQPIHTVQFYDDRGDAVLKVVMIRDAETKRYAPEQEARYEVLKARFALGKSVDSASGPP